MVAVEFAKPEDQAEVERLIAAYHASEDITPRSDRISWAVDLCLRNVFPGILLVAREKKTLVGVALGVYTPSAELGRVLTINDFYVIPRMRRLGVGRALVQKIIDEAKRCQVDKIYLEVLPTNKTAALFWKSLGFETHGRTIYSRDLQ